MRCERRKRSETSAPSLNAPPLLYCYYDVITVRQWNAPQLHGGNISGDADWLIIAKPRLMRRGVRLLGFRPVRCITFSITITTLFLIDFLRPVSPAPQWRRRYQTYSCLLAEVSVLSSQSKQRRVSRYTTFIRRISFGHLLFSMSSQCFLRAGVSAVGSMVPGSSSNNLNSLAVVRIRIDWSSTQIYSGCKSRTGGYESSRSYETRVDVVFVIEVFRSGRLAFYDCPWSHSSYWEPCFLTCPSVAMDWLIITFGGH